MFDPDHDSAGLEPLGDRLRHHRKEKKMTLQEVAEQAGFSVGFISQIERGITVPSLTSLVAVCRVLEVDVGSFFDSHKPDSSVTRSKDRAPYALGGPESGSVTYERLSASFPGNVLRSTIIHEPPGFRSEPMSHEGEEIFFILEGEMTIELEGVATILQVGDSAHFPSTLVHSTWNHTTRPTTIFHTCTMDVFGDDNAAATANGFVVTRNATRHNRSQSAKMQKTAPSAIGATKTRHGGKP